MRIFMSRNYALYRFPEERFGCYITIFYCMVFSLRLRSHGYGKKSSGPFQNRSRNWAVRKSEPEIGTIRYRTVPFSCEQKWYDIVPLSGPVWYLRVTPSWFLLPYLMSRLRLDLRLFRLFKTSTVYSY